MEIKRQKEQNFAKGAKNHKIILCAPTNNTLFLGATEAYYKEHKCQTKRGRTNIQDIPDAKIFCFNGGEER